MNLREKALEAYDQQLTEQQQRAEESDRKQRERDQLEAERWLEGIGTPERVEGSNFWFDGFHFQHRKTNWDYSTDHFLHIVLCDDCSHISNNVGYNWQIDFANLGKVLTESETAKHECQLPFDRETGDDDIPFNPLPPQATAESTLANAIRQIVREEMYPMGEV